MLAYAERLPRLLFRLWQFIPEVGDLCQSQVCLGLIIQILLLPGLSQHLTQGGCGLVQIALLDTDHAQPPYHRPFEYLITAIRATRQHCEEALACGVQVPSQKFDLSNDIRADAMPDIAFFQAGQRPLGKCSCLPGVLLAPSHQATHGKESSLFAPLARLDQALFCQQKQAFNVNQQRWRQGRVALGIQQSRGVIEADARSLLERGGWQLLKPVRQERHVVGGWHRGAFTDLFKQLRRLRAILCLQRFFDGLWPQPLLLIPQTGPTQHGPRLLFSQTLTRLVLESLRKEWMITVPTFAATRRFKKKVRLFQDMQDMFTIASVCHGIAERGRQLFESARQEQKMLKSGRLRLKDLCQKIVQHRPMATRERRQKLPYLLSGSIFLQGKGGQAQASSPSLQAGIEIEQVFCGKVRRAGLTQECLRLLQREAQICCADLA